MKKSNAKKIILNPNKLDINGKPWQEALQEIPDSEQAKFWPWEYNQLRGVSFPCARCGLKVKKGVGYEDYATVEAYQTDVAKEGRGHLYCEADAWVKGCSRAYLTKEEYHDMAYDYHIHHLTRPLYKETCVDLGVGCGTCEIWKQWLEFRKSNEQNRFSSERKFFNYWYWNIENNSPTRLVDVKPCFSST